MILNLNKSFKWFFILSLIWILIDGIPRKWFLYELAGPLFFVKYILFSITYGLFLLSKYPIPKPKHLYQFLILFFVIICIIGFFNNRLNNPIMVSIVGVVIHLLFLPLIHINQFLFKSLNSIMLLAKIIAFISFPIGILGAVQYYLPVDHILNGFTNDDQLIARAAGFTRVSSIFSFMKIYNAYLLFSITFLMGIMLIKLLRNEKIILYIAAMLILIINMFMTASRLPIMLMGINIFLFGCYVFLNFVNLRKTVSIVFTLGFILALTLYSTTNLFKNPVDSTINRFERAESKHRGESTGFTDVQLRLQDRVDIFKFSDNAGWLGYGIGMTYQGAQSIIKNPIPFYFEEEGERLVLEFGIIGGIIVVLMRLFIFIFSLNILKWCKNIEIKILLTSLIFLIIPPVLTIQMTTFSYMENFFYYFTIGLIFALYKIQQKELITKK